MGTNPDVLIASELTKGDCVMSGGRIQTIINADEATEELILSYVLGAGESERCRPTNRLLRAALGRHRGEHEK